MKNKMDFKRSKLGALLQLDESAFNSYKNSIKLKGRGTSYWRPATDSISENINYLIIIYYDYILYIITIICK